MQYQCPLITLNDNSVSMVTDAFATLDRVVLLITLLNNSCYLLVAKIIGSLQ